MAGIPAGFEDDSDSDGGNFVMYDDDYNEDQFYTPDIKPKNDAAPKLRQQKGFEIKYFHGWK